MSTTINAPCSSGPEGDTSWSLQRLRQDIPGYEHHDIDIRDREGILRLVESARPAVIVHTAAQPSHDRAAQIAFDDFDTNAVGTLNLLEAARRWTPESPFIHMSTNKVYGDRPNTSGAGGEGNALGLRRSRVPRWVFPRDFSIDQSLHSLFGASKVASDVMVQEYGRYFGMPTCALRGGCLTGPNHSGVELHGFLSYLIRCNLTGKEYKVFGYKGKQVRDNIHSEDVAAFMLAFAQKPRCGEVYNLGGGFENSCSILEAFALAAEVSGREQVWTYVESNRIGDHICYYSDLTKMKTHYPGWGITKSLKQTVAEIAASWSSRLRTHNKMKVLISGVCGFVGSHLARYLMESHEGIAIVGLDNLARSGSETNRVSLKRLGVQLFHGDIRMASDLETLPAVDWVDRRRGAAERAGRSRWENQHPPIARTQLARHDQFAGILPRLACRLHSLEHQPRLFDSGFDAVAIACGVFGLYSRRRAAVACSG